MASCRGSRAHAARCNAARLINTVYRDLNKIFNSPPPCARLQVARGQTTFIAGVLQAFVNSCEGALSCSFFTEPS